MPPTLLFTGFEPFGGATFNPSGALASSLHGRILDNGTLVHGVTLPVSGPAAWRKLNRAIRRYRPHWIIASGVSGRAGLSIETTAWNEADYPIPDNPGLQPRQTRILSRGQAKLESALTKMHPLPRDLTRLPLPVHFSHDPGRYVCNYLYYRLLHLTQRPSHSAHGRCVFLHLAATHEMRQPGQNTGNFPTMEDLQTTVLRVTAKLLSGFQEQ